MDSLKILIPNSTPTRRPSGASSSRSSNKVVQRIEEESALDSNAARSLDPAASPLQAKLFVKKVK